MKIVLPRGLTAGEIREIIRAAMRERERIREERRYHRAETAVRVVADETPAGVEEEAVSDDTVSWDPTRPAVS